MDEYGVHINVTFYNKLPGTWMEFFKTVLLSTPKDLPEIILVLSLICAIGAFLNMHLKDFPIPLPVILFLIGCSFEILSFTSFQIQRYADAIQWMNPELFFGIFTPVIIFNVAYDMDVYMLQKLFWQILLITIPGFVINYVLILWYLQSVNKLLLKTIPWLLFAVILMSSDPMLTAAAIRDLGLSRALTNLISGESLMTSVISIIVFSTIVNINFKRQYSKLRGRALAYYIYMLTYIFFHLWQKFVFLLILFFPFLTKGELVEMSGIFTLAIMGLFLNSTSFKPGVEALLLEFWNCISFVAFLMVFKRNDIFFSLLLVFIMMSPILSRLGHGFSWRWAFIMVWSEMKGTPNISMALLVAYSNFSVGTEREKSQVLFHGVLVCLINLIINRFILPMAVTKLGLRDVTSTKYKSVYYTFQHFQELTKSTASALKFDKDLANADWNMVEKAIVLQNPYALKQGETTEHQKVVCPDCNKEINETLNIEAVKLANRRLLSAQIVSTLSYRHSVLVEYKTQTLLFNYPYMTPETIKHYSESKKLLSFLRKVLLNWVYNTKKDKGIPSRYCFLRLCHKIVFTDEFEYIGYLVVLMNIFPIIISWISQLNDIYEHEIRFTNYYFLAFYILEDLLKMAAMRKDYFSHTWNIFESVISLIGIIDIILTETNFINYYLNFIEAKVIFMKIVRLLRILRILKLITPKLLQIIDKRMSHQLSFRYAILKGYVQGEADVMNIIDRIASSEQIKQMLLIQVTSNMEQAMKELGYLEYDHPEIAVTMKTKDEINVMLNMAREIVKAFRLEGILHKIEGAEIFKVIMAKKREVLDFQSVIKPLTVDETMYHIPWLEKDKDRIDFIQERAKIVTFDCGNDIFEEGDEPKGIYIIISGMVKLKRVNLGTENETILLETEEKAYPVIYTDYVLSGEIIGELNCLTNEPMKYSATCKTVVETYFIPKSHLYEAFRQKYPGMEDKMWLKIGRGITAQKIREHLSYEDWNYKMQLELYNMHIRDIPKNTKIGIYDESVTYVILIHGAVEDCLSRKLYKAPFLIPITCHQIQGIEDFTKIMIIQTSIDLEKHTWNTRKYMSTPKTSLKLGSISEEHNKGQFNEEIESEMQKNVQGC
uniref:Solute carrier family 9 member C1 n=1 Tax=Ictidomys tridecemlineatus TaxID=43179 RepID=I3LZ58_ICTTR